MNEQQTQSTKEGENTSERGIAFWIILLIGIAILTFGIFKFADKQPNKQPSINSTSTPATQNVTTSTDKDWVTGNKESSIVLTEYADFQCPACGYYHQIAKKLYKEFGTKVKFVYRNFPLRQIHKNAQLAAQAAGAGGKQGKFWEMSDTLFENQQTWSEQDNAEETFITYAKKLGLDIPQFKIDINSKEVKDKISSDYKNGIKAGVNYTPTFFLNNKKIQNPRTYDEFKNVLNQAIDKNNS